MKVYALSYELHQLISQTKALCRLADAKLSLDLEARIIMDAPRNVKERDSRLWRSNSTCWKLLFRANQRDVNNQLSAGEAHRLRQTIYYWMEHFTWLPDYKVTQLKRMYFGIVGLAPNLPTRPVSRTPVLKQNNNSDKAQVMWFKEPKTLVEFDMDVWFATPVSYKSQRTSVMMYLYTVIHHEGDGFVESESSRQMVRQYLCEFPEFVEEVRQLRPELLEM